MPRLFSCLPNLHTRISGPNIMNRLSRNEVLPQKGPLSYSFNCMPHICRNLTNKTKRCDDAKSVPTSQGPIKFLIEMGMVSVDSSQYFTNANNNLMTHSLMLFRPRFRLVCGIKIWKLNCRWVEFFAWKCCINTVQVINDNSFRLKVINI